MTQIGEGTAPPFGFSGPLEPGSLEVTVLEERSGDPVAGVDVTLIGPSRQRAVTGADGRATFPELEPGLYAAVAAQREFEIGLEHADPLVFVTAGEAVTMPLRITRILLSVELKRLWIGYRFTGGHWWTEIDGKESYGWYPAYDPWFRIKSGVPGRLNGPIDSKTATPTRDEHHGEDVSNQFHPRLLNGGSAEATKVCIRTFAREFSGTWSWPEGQNCRSFQTSLMEHCGLAEVGSKRIPRGGGEDEDD